MNINILISIFIAVINSCGPHFESQSEGSCTKTIAKSCGHKSGTVPKNDSKVLLASQLTYGTVEGTLKRGSCEGGEHFPRDTIVEFACYIGPEIWISKNLNEETPRCDYDGGFVLLNKKTQALTAVVDGKNYPLDHCSEYN